MITQGLGNNLNLSINAKIVFILLVETLQVTNLDYDEHKGRICIGRVHAGTINRSQDVKVRF